MLRIFRQNALLQLIIILMVGLGLWMPSFLNLAEMESMGGTPLYDLIYNWLSPHPLLAAVIAFVLVLEEGWLLNLALYRHKITSQNTLLPMFVYVCLMSHGGEALTLSPMILVNIMVIGSVSEMMVPDTLTVHQDQILRSATFASLASLFYLPALLLLVPLVIAFVVNSLYRWRHWVLLLLGFVAPYIVVFTVCFLNDRLTYSFYLMRSMLMDFSFTRLILPDSVWGYIAQIGTLLLVMVSLVNLVSTINEHTTMYRVNITTVCLPMVAGLLMLGFDSLFVVNLQLIALSAAAMVAVYLLESNPTSKRKVITYDIIFLLIILLQF